MLDVINYRAPAQTAHYGANATPSHWGRAILDTPSPASSDTIGVRLRDLKRSSRTATTFFNAFVNAIKYFEQEAEAGANERATLEVIGRSGGAWPMSDRVACRTNAVRSCRRGNATVPRSTKRLWQTIRRYTTVDSTMRRKCKQERAALVCFRC